MGNCHGATNGEEGEQRAPPSLSCNPMNEGALSGTPNFAYVCPAERDRERAEGGGAAVGRREGGGAAMPTPIIQLSGSVSPFCSVNILGGGHQTNGKLAHNPMATAGLHKLGSEPFELRYAIGRELGEGSSRHGVRRRDQKAVSLKILPKQFLRDEEVDHLLYEAEILHQLSHPHIIKLEEFVEDKINYYVVLELVQGPDLLSRITQRDVYSELHARNLFTALLQGVAYMHSQDIVHRDIKPENLLLSSDEDTLIKVSDFGFATRVPHGYSHHSLKAKCGTPLYMAPEIIRGEAYGKEVDVWSCGVLLYLLLAGYPPFYDQDASVLLGLTLSGVYEVVHENWYYISHDAKDLLSKLLCVDRSARLTASQALQHSWFHTNPMSLSGHRLEGTQHEMRMFNAVRRFQLGQRLVASVAPIKASMTVVHKD